jgi:ubiquinone/menaquinone biosynthesis C-methylase UbiE
MYNTAGALMHQGIRFEDGDAYDRGMGPWSRLAGQTFLDWLSPRSGLQWLDVGCGTGAFTGLLTERCAPAEVQGVDPSEGQLSIARMRWGTRKVTFCQADAMALPFEPNRFDAAVMALVIFFVPDPAKGAIEMARVVRPGGYVSAYAWDVLGGGFPFDPIWEEIRAAGIAPLLPPNPSAGELQSLRSLWTAAGLEQVETREIVVERIFQTFEDYWATSTITGGVRPTLDAMPAAERDKVKERVRTRLSVDDHGRVMWRARANAVKARVAPGRDSK